MKLSEQSEELLESLYVARVEQGTDPDMSLLKDMRAIDELVASGCVDKGNRAELTRKGIEEGKMCVRRHRLAERLLVDVLNVGPETVHAEGCRFEHVLHSGIEDKICVLLGHPRTCPHGRSIPPGTCCERSENHIDSIVRPLSGMRAGDEGVVAYLHTHDADILRKIMGMNVLPGSRIRLDQRAPTFVFSMGHSQFAVDTAIAENIFVRMG